MQGSAVQSENVPKERQQLHTIGPYLEIQVLLQRQAGSTDMQFTVRCKGETLDF